jgi:hypothetical protein
VYGAPLPGGLMVEQAQIQNRTIWIVSEEIFIAMPTTAYGRSQSCANDSLKNYRGFFSGLAYLNSTRGVRFIFRPAGVMAFFQRVIVRVLSQNGNRHITPPETSME